MSSNSALWAASYRDTTTARAAYVHVPFCRHRCGYCNFTVIAGREDLASAYLEAIEKELSQLKQPRPVDTIFLGGGTPTHLKLPELEKLLSLVTHWFPLTSGGEFTSEANPRDLAGVVGKEKLQLLTAFGVNRLSLGVQSFRDEKLMLLQRDHTAEVVDSVLQQARPLFESISLDLIFAAPAEEPTQWDDDLNAAISRQSDHVSTYNLTYEKGTQFWNRQAKGELVAAAEEWEETMYAAAIDKLTAAGFEHYEVSNFAKPGFACRHNLAYWLGESYYGVGPGATRFLAGERATNHRSTTTYLRRVLADQDPTAERETLPPELAARERFAFALRMLPVVRGGETTGGVDKTWFQSQTGFAVEELLGKELLQLASHGLIEQTEQRVTLTRRGLFVADSVFAELLF